VTSALGGGLRGEGFLEGGLTGAAIGGVQLVGVKNNWDPGLTNVASLTAGQLTMGSLRGFEGNIKDANGNIIGYGPISFEEGISQIVLPDLAQNLTFIGVQKLGVQLGLTPQQANLAALPLSISVGGTARGNSAAQISQAVSAGLAKGVTSLVLTQALGGDGNDLGTAVTGRAVTGAIEAGLNGQNIFSGIATALGQSTLNAISFDDSQGFVRQQAELIEFGQIAREQGIENAIDQHATAIFQRDSLEAVFRSGQTIAQWFQRSKTQAPQITLPNGRAAKEIRADAGTTLYLDPDTEELIARQIGDRLEIASKVPGRTGYVLDENGELKLVNGEVRQTFSDGSQARMTVVDGDLTFIEGVQDGKTIFLVTPPKGKDRILMNADGSIRDGVWTDLSDYSISLELDEDALDEELGVSFYIEENRLAAVRGDRQFIDRSKEMAEELQPILPEDFKDLTDQQIQQVSEAVANKIINEKDPTAVGTPPAVILQDGESIADHIQTLYDANPALGAELGIPALILTLHQHLELGAEGERLLETFLRRSSHIIIDGPSLGKLSNSGAYDILTFDPQTNKLTAFDNKARTKPVTISDSSALNKNWTNTMKEIEEQVKTTDRLTVAQQKAALQSIKKEAVERVVANAGGVAREGATLGKRGIKFLDVTKIVDGEFFRTVGKIAKIGVSRLLDVALLWDVVQTVLELDRQRQIL